MRSIYCGQVNEAHAGQTITLCGWVHRRRDLGGLIFIDMRDREGIVQVFFDPDKPDAFALASELRGEFCIQVSGVVRTRPDSQRNSDMATGAIEVFAHELTIINRAEPLPLDFNQVISEEQRLKFRYLDLRRPEMAKYLKTRAKASAFVRRFMDEHGFLDIETPMLTKATPEGARDYLVPSRVHKGKFYALPQSPQLFKQLLQVGGFEKYYQIARCYRDEDFRADRQPEFTQLDIEASFVEQDDIIELGEALVKDLWKLIDVEIPTPIARITYHEAMAKYGSDKPDLRFGLELSDMTEFFKDTEFGVFKAAHVGAVVMPGGASQPRRTLDGWQEFAKQRGHKGLAYVLYKEDGELAGPVAKNLTETERAGLAEATGAKPGDCIFFAAGSKNEARALLGAARVEIGHRTGLIKEGDWAFVWVVDAPMFEPAAAAVASGDVAVGSGAWTAVHHAFTSPKPEFMDTFDTDPESALAYAYDIVCNGNEIGGGSIRIHQADLQQRVFKMMGIDEEAAQEKFGFLLEGFKYGAPPHGGMALGWDRVLQLLTGSDSIRDVIAFPKTGGGFDPLTAAPAPITAQQRKEAGVDAKPEAKKAETNEPGENK